jgi:hypothetical protein
MQIVLIDKNNEPVVFVNRPAVNKKIAYWLHAACEKAVQIGGCCFFLSCDTAEQAEKRAKRAAKWLPNHERAAIERPFDPATRARGNLV